MGYQHVAVAILQRKSVGVKIDWVTDGEAKKMRATVDRFLENVKAA